MLSKHFFEKRPAKKANPVTEPAYIFYFWLQNQPLTLLLPPPPARTNYFPALTGFRAVAAYLVFIHHTAPDLLLLPPVVARLLMVPDTGVIAFFVLSGFLIAYWYAGAAGVKINYQTYLTKRLARTYPLYLLLTVVVLLWQKDRNPEHWFLNLTLLQSFFDANVGGIRPAWSLSIQEIFYLAAPGLFIGFRKFPGRLLGAVLVAGGGLVWLSGYFDWQPFMASVFFMLRSTVFGYIFSFYVGYRLARVYKQRPANQNPDSQASSYTYLGIGGAVVCLYLETVSRTFTGQDPAGLSAAVVLLLMNGLYPLTIAVLLYGLLTENTLPARLLATRPAQWLGRRSYAFYLIHTGLFYEAVYFHLSKNMLIIFLILNVAAAVFYQFFEQPVYRYIRRRSAAKPTFVPQNK